MSHLTVVQTQWKEEKYVRMSLDRMGFKYVVGPGLKVKAFGGREVPVDILVKLPMSYDIGLRKVGGAYEIVADWTFTRGINQKSFMEQMNLNYGKFTALDKMQEKGFNLVEEKVEEGGQIRILLRRMA